jgi:two-component system CheB/CheR fusion protein
MTSRRCSGALSTRERAWRDGLAAISVVAAGAFCFTRFDTVERISHALRPWENFELDDLILGSGLFVLAACWFAIRRWRDALRELHAREASERDKARYVRRLEELSTQLLESEHGERARIAELLHDEIGQTLYACRLQLESLQSGRLSPEDRRQLEAALALASTAMDRTRDLTIDLCPPVLRDLGLGEALEWLVERGQERWQLSARVVPSHDWDVVPNAWREPVFQSVSELLANAAKHARATEIEVSAAAGGDGRLRVCVRDNGCGFERDARARQGFGLFSIERRIAFLGGRLHVESARGAGTSAVLDLPIDSRDLVVH